MTKLDDTSQFDIECKRVTPRHLEKDKRFWRNGSQVLDVCHEGDVIKYQEKWYLIGEPCEPTHEKYYFSASDDGTCRTMTECEAPEHPNDILTEVYELRDPYIKVGYTIMHFGSSFLVVELGDMQTEKNWYGASNYYRAILRPIPSKTTRRKQRPGNK